MAAEATGSAVLAIRRLKKPATPAAAPTGPSATGSHIIRLPKLALSCSRKISAAVTRAPAAVSADRLRSKRPVSTLATIRSMPCTGSGAPAKWYAFRAPSYDFSSSILSLNSVVRDRRLARLAVQERLGELLGLLVLDLAWQRRLVRVDVHVDQRRARSG